MLHSHYTEELQIVKNAGNLRQLKHFKPTGATTVIYNRETYLMMSSNNYLGLTHHPEVIKAAQQAVEEYGTGSGGSRLMSGSHQLFLQLENQLADFKKTEKALVFNTGYMANLGILSALLTKDDFVFSDALNHASIIDGIRLSKAQLTIYKHKDMNDLERLLKQCQSNRTKLIVTDSVFSMDGDIAPLDELYALSRKYNALLMVDDAHATGVLGDGYGSAAHFNLHGKIDLQVGTLSKALASEGGFVATSSLLQEYLINKARSFIYSTALTPADIAAASTALRLVREDTSIIRRLQHNVSCLRTLLRDSDIQVETETPIFPIVTGDTNVAIHLADYLWDNKIIATPIRPPTVPENAARLRITVSAAHTEEDLQRLVKMLVSA